MILVFVGVLHTHTKKIFPAISTDISLLHCTADLMPDYIHLTSDLFGQTITFFLFSDTHTLKHSIRPIHSNKTMNDGDDLGLGVSKN